MSPSRLRRTVGIRRLRARLSWALGAALLVPSAFALSPSDLYAQLSPSVWRVVTYDADGLPLGQGSGVVIGTETLVTNCHVLAKSKRVSVQREKLKFDARLELWDTERDLCQLKVAGLQAPAVKTGAAADLKVGQNVYAIGNPKGLESTLSAGLLSSLRRDDAGRVILLQTSAPISGGSSGGGLFDEQGRLVGVTTIGSVTGDAQNLNFAVPADWVVDLPARHAKRNAARSSGAAASAASAPAQAAAPAEPPGAATGWRRGDEIEYTVTDLFTGQTRQARAKVDRVEADRIVFNDGARVEGLDGRLVDLGSALVGDMDVMAPPGGWVEQDAASRLRWSASFERRDASTRTSYDLQGRFEGDVTLDTPAGSFPAMVIAYDGWARRNVIATPSPIPLQVKVRVWYSPALKRVIRFESDVRPSGNGIYATLASRERAELVRVRRER